MRRLFRNKRAVSTVMGAVMMILVVAIGMSMLFAFFINYTRDFQTGSGSSVLESMTIEDVWFKTSNSIEIWVYNLGKVDSNITAVYLNGLSVSYNVNAIYLDGEPVDYTVANPNLPVGAHTNIKVSFSWDENSIYGFKLTTKRGSAFEGKYVSPSM